MQERQREFLNAIANGNLKLVKRYLRSSKPIAMGIPVSLYETDEEGRNPFMYAAVYSRFENQKSILEAFVEHIKRYHSKKFNDIIYAKDKEGNTALHLALLHYDKKDFILYCDGAIKYLISIFPQELRSQKNKQGKTPLMLALELKGFIGDDLINALRSQSENLPITYDKRKKEGISNQGSNTSSENSTEKSDSHHPQKVHNQIKKYIKSDLSHIPMVPVEDIDLQNSQKTGERYTHCTYKAYWQQCFPVALKDFKLLQKSPEKLKDLPELQGHSVKNEVNIILNSNHPAIIKTHGVVETSISFMFVIELLEGGTLYNYLRMAESRGLLAAQTEWEWHNRVYFMYSLSLGLDYLHNSLNVPYCNIQSPNISLYRSSEGYWLGKITDFEIPYQQKTDVTPHTVVYSIDENIPWLAPELISRSTLPTKESDIYSFGIMLWEVVSYEVPFSNFSKTRKKPLQNAILEGERPAFKKEFGVAEDGEYAKLTKSCWVAKSEERMKAKAVAKALNTCLKNLGFFSARNSATTTTTTTTTTITMTTTHQLPNSSYNSYSYGNN